MRPSRLKVISTADNQIWIFNMRDDLARASVLLETAAMNYVCLPSGTESMRRGVSFKYTSFEKLHLNFIIGL